MTFLPLFRIRIRMFWGVPDPYPDPLVRGTNPRIRIRSNMSRVPNTGPPVSALSNLDRKFGRLNNSIHTIHMWTLRYQWNYPPWNISGFLNNIFTYEKNLMPPPTESAHPRTQIRSDRVLNRPGLLSAPIHTAGYPHSPKGRKGVGGYQVEIFSRQTSAVCPDPDMYFFGPSRSGSVLICTDPDPSIIKQKK